MANKKNLQKFTETAMRIETIMQKNKITQHDVNTMMQEADIPVFQKYLTDRLNSVNGEDRDLLLNKIEEIIPIDTKNQLWENNHFMIIQSLSKLIEEYGKMPTKNRISKDTGLSRQTIHKHLKNYAESPLYAEQLKQFAFMSERVLAKVIKMAVQGEGNVKAARLYFDVMGYFGNQSGVNINTQNNYIQINETKLSQETIKHLDPEQLNTIEKILKTAVQTPTIIKKES